VCSIKNCALVVRTRIDNRQIIGSTTIRAERLVLATICGTIGEMSAQKNTENRNGMLDGATGAARAAKFAKLTAVKEHGMALW